MTAPTISTHTTTLPESGSTNIDSLLSGDKWGGGVGTLANLTYSFPWQNGLTASFAGYNGQPYSSLNESSATYHFGFDSTQIASAVSALNDWASVTNITLTQLTESSTNVGDIRFAFTSATQNTPTGETAWGWAGYPNSYWPSAGDIWVSTASSGNTDLDWTVGSYNFYSLVHEIGHAIGLKHPFEGSPKLTSNFDSRLYTVMSYTNAPGCLFVKVTSNLDGSVSWSSFNVYPETPMLLDIAAIQYLYGANNTYKTGDDVYTFDPHTPFFKTIWDAGGVDTISVSNFTEGCEINLNAGSFSKITIKSDSTAGYNWTTQPPVPTYDGTNNLCIAYGVVIENVIGGSGNDTLIGNTSDNSLAGGNGNDTIYGGDGNDTFDWAGDVRSGNDVFYGGLGDDVYVFNSNQDLVVEKTNEGTDTIWVNFDYSLEHDVNVEILRGFGASGISLRGNDLNNILSATQGNDLITATLGTDTVDGEAGTDTIVFSGNYSAYTLTAGSNGAINVRSSSLGSDLVSNVERFQFKDNWYANDTSANNVAQVIYAAFGKMYVKQFMAEGLTYADAGMDLNRLCELVTNNHLVESVSGLNTTKSFVDTLFNNVVGRMPTAMEEVSFTSQIDTGKLTKQGLLELAAAHSLTVSDVNALKVNLIGIPFDPLV